MISIKIPHISTTLAAVFLAVFVIVSANQTIVAQDSSSNNQPTVVSTSPSDGEVDVARNIVIEITISEVMDSTSMQNSTFTLMQGENNVEGTLEYLGEIVLFTSTNNLEAETIYTASLIIGNYHSENEFNDERSETNYPVNNGKEWSFTTGGNSDPVGAINLGSAAEYVILAQSYFKNEAPSEINGEKGYDSDHKESKEPQTIYWVKNEDIDKEAARRDSTVNNNDNRDYATNPNGSNSENLNEAFKDMIVAYNDAADHSSYDFIDFSFLHSDNDAMNNSDSNRNDDYETDPMDSPEMGHEMDTHRDHLMEQNLNPDLNQNTSSMILEPGVYMWNESVEISSNITLSGNANDVWIFQIPENLTLNRDVQITLSEGALTENIFWQVAGDVNLEESSHFEGIILSLTDITMKSGATLNGRMFAQTDITLDDNTINQPVVRTSIQSSTFE